MNVDYVPVVDIHEIRAIENGEDGWRECSVEKQGLVRCTSPIKGTVYRVKRFGCPLDDYYCKAMVMRLLGSKCGRVFANSEGILRVAIDLPEKAFEFVLMLIMKDAYEMAGYKY